jgi:hypothetical protein
MLFSISGITIFGADINYNFNITDNFKWNLETGAIESDLKFAITSKMIIGNTDIETIAETYHHVVFWNNKNQYIGYKNTQYSILENAYYLGDIERGNLGFDAPANAHFFSFMIYKSGNRIPDANLNNQSLFEIFGTYSTNNLHQKDNNELDGYDLDDLYNTQLNSKNIFDPFNFNDIGLYIATSSMSNTLSSLVKSLYIAVNPNSQYTVSRIAGQRFRVATSTNIPSPSSALNNVITDDTGSEITISTQANDNYLVVYYWNDGAHTYTAEQLEASMQIEENASATPYELHENYLTRDYFKDYEQISSTNYTELDNGRLRYVVNQDTITNEFQPLHELNGLTLNDLFDTNFNSYPHGNTHQRSGGTNINIPSWALNSSHTIDNHLLFIGVAMTNDVNTDMRHYKVSSPTQSNTFDFIFANSTDTTYQIIDIEDYVAINMYQPVTYTGTATITIHEYFYIDLTALGLENLTSQQLQEYYEIYKYFDNGGTEPQTFTYDSPIYYDITYRLDEQFNGLNITAQQFIDFQDGYNRIINNEQANDFIIYYAVQHAQDNNPTLSFTTEQWEQYYYNYLLFEDANTPYIEELNYYSLDEIFYDNNKFRTNTPTLYYGSGNYTYLHVEYTVTQPDNSARLQWNNTSGQISELYDYMYIRLDLQSEQSIPDNKFRTGDLGKTFADYTPNELITYTFIKQHTGSVGYYRKYQRTINMQIGDIINYYNLYAINLTQLNLAHLSEQDMNGYYDDYINNQTLEQNLYLSALETGSFSLIQPYYDYTAPPPDDFLDVSPDDFLGNILTDIGFNNDLGKSVLAIVILFFTAFTLFRYNMPNSVIIGVTVLTYVGLTFLGWLPAWINIVIAMIFILLMYLRFKGSGGSGNEENI